ncbi:predicted protein [Plenodomus lingam JN3]|uniref:Predicted protein n=1 Tax=Leptosphaeria maculans (strain JN3 / isolate v23.1.3 / race Av1-4-5-6-7-8) TaxID=985895 RepID=E4ZTC6_LEPMJ|nr:predicted protein [Plenodomus lingam JN3]CBX94782.1 predicted protein [Plenodomus lingam JN3]
MQWSKPASTPRRLPNPTPPRFEENANVTPIHWIHNSSISPWTETSHPRPVSDQPAGRPFV